MRLLVGATRSMVWRNCAIAAERPIKRGRLRRHLLELLDLALEPRGFQRAFGHQHQPVGLERLLDEIVGAVLDGGDRGFDVAVAGDHHHRQFGMLLLDGVEQLQPVELAALQPDIEEHQVRLARHDSRKRIVAVARGARVIALVLQNPGHQIADIGLVVDNQNIRGHAHYPFTLVCFSGVGLLPYRRRQQTARAPRRPAGREFSRRRRATRCCRHDPRQCGRRWRGPDRCPSRAS